MRRKLPRSRDSGTSHVAAASSQCLSSFDVLCAELDDPKSTSLDHDGARCEQGRFRAWCESLGALEHGRCSLDSRLRESAEVLASVTGLLHELQLALFESVAIVSGSGSACQQEKQPDGHLHLRQTSIVEIITDLHALGSQIGSNHKEADPIEIYSRYSEYDRQHVSELLRELRKGRLDPDGTYDYIIPRFAAALTLRRKQFKSWERHEPAPAVSWGSESKNGSRCPVVANGDSKTSSDQPIDANPEHIHVPFPAPPGETKEFTCPYCWEVCPVESGQPQLWRAHVIRDLQPYVCTYEQCPGQYQLYGSRKQWIDHENTFHRRLWRCRRHRTSVHSSMEGLGDHFRQIHACSLDEGRLQGLVDTSLSSFVNDRCTCPICLSSGPFCDGLEHHLADHLERIATFALQQNVGVGNLPEDSPTRSIKSLEIDVYTSTSRDTDPPGDACPQELERDDFARRLHNHNNDQQSNFLLSAVYTGNHAQVDSLLQQGANADAMDGDDKTALAYAAEKGFQAIARMLHDHGADPNFKSLFQGTRTPLTFAVAARQHDIVNMMFEHGATPTHMNIFQDTTIMHAAAKGDEAMVRILAGRGVDPDARNMYGESALSLAAEVNHFTIVEFLLDSGVEVDPKRFEMRTPLSLAAANGHKEIVNILLDHGADPNYTDGRGMSPLSWAAENGHARLVSTLLARGASFHLTALRISAFKQGDILKLLMAHDVDPDLVDYRGRTPLLIAASEGHETMARTLLDSGADPNATTDPAQQRTPLLAAISDGNFTIVRALLAKGADPNHQDPTGRTPLSWAAETGHVEIVRALLGAGSSPHTPDSVSGETPLHHASSRGHASVVQLLLSRGAEHKTACRAGQTAVLKAAKTGSFLTVAVLLCSGADPDVCDEGGRAPLFYAVRSGDRWMMEVLRWKSASKKGRVPVPATISCFDRLTR